MAQSRLKFDDEERKFVRAADRTAPSLWIRRLVVFNQIDGEPLVIRSVPFRLGLNIINTAKPDPNRDGPVGHDVGKTLLTRLIRYCLGETTFGRDTLQRNIKRKFPAAHVAAELVISNQNWVVIRPLGVEQSTTFKAVKAESWRDALDSPSELPLSEFKDLCLETTGLNIRHQGESRLLLPKANREIRWLDVLAWLGRDQNCRYRRPLEWRSDFSESHTKNLSELDASVLVRAMLDLLDDHESNLVRNHRKLLRRKRVLISQVNELTDSTTQVRSFLTKRLNLDGDALASAMFAQAAVQAMDQARESLLKERESVSSKWNLRTLGNEFEEAKRRQIQKDRDVELKNERISDIEGILRQTRAQADDIVKKAIAKQANLCDASLEVCPLKSLDQNTPSRAAFRKQQIEIYEADLADEKGRLADLSIESNQLKLTRDETEKKLATATEGAKAELELIDKEIAKIDAQKEEAQGFESEQVELDKAVEALEKVTRRIAASRESQHQARIEVANRHAQLNEHLVRVFQELTLQESTARIAINLRGIQVITGDEERDSGEAIASESALAFDLASLSASICGLGTFPRFIIHDSPREGDLEPHIYERLFRFIHSLEEECDSAVSFQYIIATTTPPPEKLAVKPFVILTLDAREPGGLLLGERF